MTPAAQTLIWQSAGLPEQKHQTEVAAGRCMICGTEIDGRAVPVKRIIKSTTVGDSQLFRFRQATHFCIPCAWLMEIGKGRPGNFIASEPTGFELAVISVESVVQDKRPWLHIVRDLVKLPPETPITGVLTTDVKIRLWHRCQIATIGDFGLYIHALDYDVSEWRRFDLDDLCRTIADLIPILRAGYAKSAIYHSLFNDYKRASRDPAETLRLESTLARLRNRPEFLPALLMAGVTKEEKRAHAKPARHTDTTPADRGEADPAQLGLF